MVEMPEEMVPTWNGEPSSFEAFATSCRWYVRGLKETERRLAASRVWQRLSGAAKSVVRHLDPVEFDKEGGLDKLLGILRASPLQQLPVPDSFGRLEKWNNLRRLPQETIPQLLVREEELFTELQQSLSRARQERVKKTSAGVGTSGPEREPTASPTRSPSAWQGIYIEEVEKETIDEPKDVMTNDFFGDELRGYRLLKAAKLASSERQHVLTLTRNSTRFIDIRRALRTLFSDDPMEDGGAPRMPRRTVWWSQESPWEDDDGYYEDEWWDSAVDHDAYWTDDWGWDESSYMDGYEYEAAEEDTLQYEDVDDIKDSPENERYQEAYTIAKEAHKTLAEARQAVAKVRAARGYFDPAGMKGTSSKGKGKGGRGKGKGKPRGGQSGVPHGPCFICGSHSHGYTNCPDRWQPSQGSPSASPTGKGKGKMKSKKGKQKGKNFYSYDFFVEIEKYDDLDYVNVLSLQDDDGLSSVQDAKVIIDTGATESVAGVTCMARLLDRIGSNYKVNLADRPRFKFGNGQVQQATSRVDICTKALSDISFYLLDGAAEFTPPLLGGRELWFRQAMVAYGGEYMVHRSRNGNWWLNHLTALRGKHIAMDMNEMSEPLNQAIKRMRRGGGASRRDDDDYDDSDGMGGQRDLQEEEVLVMATMDKSLFCRWWRRLWDKCLLELWRGQLVWHPQHPWKERVKMNKWCPLLLRLRKKKKNQNKVVGRKEDQQKKSLLMRLARLLVQIHLCAVTQVAVVRSFVKKFACLPVMVREDLDTVSQKERKWLTVRVLKLLKKKETEERVGRRRISQDHRHPFVRHVSFMIGRTDMTMITSRKEVHQVR